MAAGRHLVAGCLGRHADPVVRVEVDVTTLPFPEPEIDEPVDKTLFAAACRVLKRFQAFQDMDTSELVEEAASRFCVESPFSSSAEALVWIECTELACRSRLPGVGDDSDPFGE